MVTKKKSGVLVFVATLVTATLLATSALSATPDNAPSEPTVAQPQVEVTAPPDTSETKMVPLSEQKSTDKQDKEKTDKKKGPMAGMMLTLFAIITGHQGTTR